MVFKIQGNLLLNYLCSDNKSEAKLIIKPLHTTF